MTLDVWLKSAKKRLEVAEISTARLDTLVLLEDVIKKDRGWLLAHPEFELDPAIVKILDKQIKRRAKHEPLAYIRGRSEFYGREFLVTPETLQPRSETETMIDLLKTEINNVDKKLSIIDVGTGSGCLAITAKLEWPLAKVYATEINNKALEIAKQNALILKANVEFYLGNLLDPIMNNISKNDRLIILANLPYVPDTHTINQAAMYEPKVAIFGGLDGLDLYRQMFEQITQLPVKPPYVFIESLPFQHTKLVKIALKPGYHLANTSDFIQIFTNT